MPKSTAAYLLPLIALVLFFGSSRSATCAHPLDSIQASTVVTTAPIRQSTSRIVERVGSTTILRPAKFVRNNLATVPPVVKHSLEAQEPTAIKGYDTIAEFVDAMLRSS